MIKPIIGWSLFLLSSVVNARRHETISPQPKLIIAISVDQFGANLFDEYRASFTGGLKRLSTEGLVFPNGYQTHAATETCPGHSTILTGDHPVRTGIIANSWLDLDTARADKTIYCTEDEHVAGSDSKNYTVSAVHLRVPTLGERLKALNPATRVVSVAGKDRAAVMMGGHKIDQAWWWTNRDKTYQFVSFAGLMPPAAVSETNNRIKTLITSGYAYPPLPDACKARIAPVHFGLNTIGVARPPMPPGDGSGLYTHPALDAATLDIALGLINELKLGQGSAPDILSIGLSVTDPVGHAFGTEGPEMCGQIYALDASLGDFLGRLDATGVNYELVLTADHGGHDIPERPGADPKFKRLGSDSRTQKLDIDIATKLNIPGHALYSESSDTGGNLYIAHDLAADVRAKVAAAVTAQLADSADVDSVFTREQIMAAPPHPAIPSQWTLLQRVAASYDPVRGGDLYVVLKEGMQTISDPDKSVMAHGSVWNYDRRVPIIFFAKGMAPATYADEIETVDIMPTLASMIGLPLAAGEVDGKCLAQVAGSPCLK